jgi:hypothetical protein
MRKLAVCFLLLFFIAWCGQQDEAFRQVDEMSRELADMTGLALRHSVQRDLITRDKLKGYLEERIREIIKPEEIRAEELTLKKFGFVPQDFDLKKTTIDLLAEQAAAFYDFRKKKLFLLEGNSGEMQRMALIHELAHALADQHFNLERYITKESNDDGAMARGAIMEGQAQWLMFEHMARRMGANLKDRPDLLNLVSGGVEGAGQFPELNKAPLYIKESLLFPYQSGLRFMHTVFLAQGKPAFSNVFRRPPLSTQQIIHPELYFQGRKPTRPPLPRFNASGYRILTEGAIGELDFSVLLRQYGNKDEDGAISPQWRGGRYRVYEHKKDGTLVLAYTVEWNDESTARRYFDVYRQKVLPVKWKKMETERQSEARVEGVGDDGRFLLEQSGNKVSSLEGIRYTGKK